MKIQNAFAGLLSVAALLVAGSGQVHACTPQPVPEPSSVATMALGGLGLVGLVWRARKR